MNKLIIISLFVTVAAQAQTHQVIVSKKFNVKTSSDIVLKPGDAGSIDLTDTSKVYMFLPGPGVTKLNYSVPGGTPNPLPITIQALNYLTMFGVSRGTDYIGSTDLNDYVHYGFIQSGKFAVSATYSRGENNPATGRAEVRVTATGAVIGTLTFRNTGGWGSIITENVGEITVPTGTTSIYIKFTTIAGNGNFRSWTFTP